MIRIGVTGGMGAGKTCFCKRLEAAGLPVFYADDEAKKLLIESEEVQAAIRKLLGDEVYNEDGSLNAKMVSDMIFANPRLRTSMNNIVHPAVARRFLKWSDEQDRDDNPATFIETAILYECNFDRYVNKVIVVTAPPRVRIERAMKRDGVDEEAIRRRIKTQWTDKRKTELADYVINNGPQDDLNRQVFALLKKIYDPNSDIYSGS